jgi:hypothetical protein
MTTRLHSQQELDIQCCSNPECHCDDSILYFVPLCYDAPVEVRYEKPLGQIIVSCHVCEREVIRIAVRETLP